MRITGMEGFSVVFTAGFFLNEALQELRERLGKRTYASKDDVHAIYDRIHSEKLLEVDVCDALDPDGWLKRRFVYFRNVRIVTLAAASRGAETGMQIDGFKLFMSHGRRPEWVQSRTISSETAILLKQK